MDDVQTCSVKHSDWLLEVLYNTPFTMSMKILT